MGCNIFSKKKRGLSNIVGVVVVILLVISAGAVVWTVVKNLVDENIGKTESCFDVGFSDKVTLNNDYTCFDSSKGEVNFSVGVGDIEIEELIVSVSVNGASKSFVLTNEAQEIQNLKNLDGSLQIVLPGKNAGLTYVASGFSGEELDWIKISPKVDGQQCEVSDTIYEVYDCKDFV